MSAAIWILILIGVFFSGYIVAWVINEEDRDSYMYAKGFHDGYNKCLDDINYGRVEI